MTSLPDRYTLMRPSMTVCIAAVCPTLNAIVMVSDTMLSDDTFSREFGAIKFAELDQRKFWMCLFAGFPASYSEVHRKAKTKIDAMANTATLDDVKAAIERTYADIIDRRVCELLRPMNMTRTQFRDSGLEKLGVDEFANTLTAIKGTHLGLDLIVVGFDQNGKAHIFAVDSYGACYERDTEGFVAIGMGAAMATATLNLRDDFRLSGSTEAVIYDLCEAKVAAQAARSVGDTTFGCVFHSDGRLEIVMSTPLGRINKSLKERARRRKATRSMLGIIRDGLDQIRDPRSN
jgi:hypothetical protein